MGTVYTTINVKDAISKLALSNYEARIFSSGIDPRILEVSETGTFVDLSNIGNAGQIMLRNNDPDSWLGLGFASGDYPVRIQPNGAALLPLNTGVSAVYLISESGNVKSTMLSFEA